MAEYKIKQVSSSAPKEWKGNGGTTYYIKVALEGHARPVSIGKKRPDALRVGDTVYGTIIDQPGYPEDKFKAEQQGNFSGSAGNKSDYEPKDQLAIRAQWAIGQAIASYHVRGVSDAQLYDGEIEKLASHLFNMVDRVKAGKEAIPLVTDVDESVASALDMFGGEVFDEEF